MNIKNINKQVKGGQIYIKAFPGPLHFTDT